MLSAKEVAYEVTRALDSKKGMVPFCAYNLTDVNGRALYRK